jgi:hypothetical protein
MCGINEINTTFIFLIIYVNLDYHFAQNLEPVNGII